MDGVHGVTCFLLCIEGAGTIYSRRQSTKLHFAGDHVEPVLFAIVARHRLDSMPKDAHGLLIPGSLSPTRTVSPGIERPEYVATGIPASYTGDDTYDAEGIARIRRAGAIASGALDAVEMALRPGMTTDDIDALVHDFVTGHGAYPSTLGYRGYPKSCCTSLNEVICHGIPDDTVISEGDLVNVDVTAFLDGVHGDTNRTFIVGTTSDQARDLVDRTREALMRGIKAVAPGRQVNVIGRAIESYAKRFGYGVVRDYTGHGVGTHFHSGLIIPHHDSAPQYDTEMRVGMVFTIEPMLTLGTHEWDIWADDWTVVTRDRSLTAQFEHTVVVTDSGAEILTLS